METDKHYFVEGLFIIGLCIAAAVFFAWLAGSGHRGDVTYRIRFADSVSGLSLGDPVKYHGVDIGVVDAMSIDPADSRLTRVDVKLRKDAPVKTDTKATLKLKGITGVVFVELNGGSPEARTLLAATPSGQEHEIPAEKTVSLAELMEHLPKLIDKVAGIEDETKKVLSDVGGVTKKIKENPSLLLRPPKDKDKEEDKDKRAAPLRQP